MNKRKSLKGVLTFGFLFSLLAFVIYQFIDDYAYQRFRPNIAQCRDIDEVKVIAAGRLKKPNEKAIRFGNKREADQDDVGPPPKPVYTFKSVKGYKGLATRPRGNEYGGFNLMIREGEAPEDVLGKRALICVSGGGFARELEAIYIEQ